MDKDERDPFAGLRWEVEIVRLADPHTPFNLSPECGVSGAKRFRDDYEITPFLQSTQAWKSRLEEEDRQRYDKPPHDGYSILREFLLLTNG